jgi:hypothetical protein
MGGGEWLICRSKLGVLCAASLNNDKEYCLTKHVWITPNAA